MFSVRHKNTRSILRRGRQGDRAGDKVAKVMILMAVTSRKSLIISTSNRSYHCQTKLK